jgi:TetR/AcrR family transcriptional regulator
MTCILVQPDFGDRQSENQETAPSMPIPFHGTETGLSFPDKTQKDFGSQYTNWYAPVMNTKDQMIAAATELFSSEGYEGVGVQRIVDACGVQKPTLYHYFGSKEGLLREILHRDFHPFLDRLETSCIFRGDLTATLERCVKTHFSFASEKKMLYGFYLAQMFAPRESGGSKIFMPSIERHYAIIEEMFRSAENSHGNMRGRSKRYAITFAGHINACITAWHYDQIALSGESASLACKHFMHGILS